MGEPQVGQVWSDGRVVGKTVSVPSALRVYSLVLRHSGKPEQGKK